VQNIQYSYHRYGLSSLTWGAVLNKPNLYTQTEIDGFLLLKADQSTTYTKTEVDNGLALKADNTALISMRDNLLLAGQLSSCIFYMPLAFSNDCVVQQGTKLIQLTDGTTTYGTWTPVTKTLDPREGIELTPSDYVVVGYFFSILIGVPSPIPQPLSQNYFPAPNYWTFEMQFKIQSPPNYFLIEIRSDRRILTQDYPVVKIFIQASPTHEVVLVVKQNISTYTSASSPTVWTADEWRHIALGYNSTMGAYKLFLDGTQIIILSGYQMSYLDSVLFGMAGAVTVNFCEVCIYNMEAYSGNFTVRESRFNASMK